MPQLGPINWLILYTMVWSTLLGIFMELYWLQAPIAKINTSPIISINEPSKKLVYNYAWQLPPIPKKKKMSYDQYMFMLLSP